MCPPVRLIVNFSQPQSRAHLIIRLIFRHQSGALN